MWQITKKKLILKEQLRILNEKVIDLKRINGALNRKSDWSEKQMIETHLRVIKITHTKNELMIGKRIFWKRILALIQRYNVWKKI